MTTKAGGLSRCLNVEQAKHWRSADGQIAQLLREVGLTGDEHSKALYIFGKASVKVDETIDELDAATADDGRWFYISGENRE
jgi:hypothetical protein